MQENILSVAQVNAYMKRMLDMDYILKNIWIQGEVSNCKIHGSGHVYFTLKDEFAAISCVLFKGFRKIDMEILRDGMKIIAKGSVSIYEKSGQYQLYVKDYIEDGIGVLYKRFEMLKNRLNDLGWFLDEIKKPIPYYPKSIGIISSETGAALQDMLNIANRRNPYIQLYLYPSLVQGEEAKFELVKAIQYFDNMDEIDVIVIGRGGGSLEDLWPFNEEIVAEAIFHSKTPIVSAVGHETDYTISDFVADLRAPTPSAAMELIIPSFRDITLRLEKDRRYLDQILMKEIDRKKSLLKFYSERIERFHPRSTFEQILQYLSELEDKLHQNMMLQMKDKKNQLILLGERLKKYSPLDKLKDGYVYIMDEEGHHIKRVDGIKEKEILTIQLYDGKVRVRIENIEKGRMDYGSK